MADTIDKILNILGKMDIANAHADAELEDELGMDSQEMVEFLTIFGKELGIPLNDDIVTKKMTVRQLAGKLDGSQSAKPGGEGAESSLTEETLIQASVQTVYERLLNVRDWPSLLPHVEQIDMVYDDGRYQEFYMSVKGTDGSAIKVRSVRKCEPGEILFFQPQPPVFLKTHNGGWQFSPTESGGCRVVTYHNWRLSEQAAVIYPDDGHPTAQRVEALLREHARFALNSWKSIIEGAGHG